MTDDENLFLSEQHPVSQRRTVLEDDGRVIWFYLTGPGSSAPVADVWVHNRVQPPSPEDIQRFRPNPPPAPIGYVDDVGLMQEPLAHCWSFRWAANGEAVALIIDGKPVAFLRSSQRFGFTRHLRKDGPWGHPWSDEEYRKDFGEA